MIRRLLGRAGDALYALGWALTWRLGRTAGRLAHIDVTCPKCGAHLCSSLTEAGRAMRLHNQAHALLERIEARGDIPNTVPRRWTR